MDEVEAVVRLKHGDLSGLEFLVRRYQAQAVHAAYLILGERATAEDVVQAAFLRAAERIGQFDASRRFGPWFLRSVANDAIKAANHSRRYVSLEANSDRDETAPANWLANSDPGPEELAETTETRQAVWQALEQLPPEQRAVIVLRHFLEFSEADITLEMGRPLSTVKWWLRASRERLRGLLRSFRTAGANRVDGNGQE